MSVVVSVHALSKPRRNSPKWLLRLIAPSGNRQTTSPLSNNLATVANEPLLLAQDSIGIQPTNLKKPFKYQRS